MAPFAPTLQDRRTKAAFDLFKELNCIRGGEGDDDAALTIDDVVRLDEDKMMARALDCLAAVCEAQRVRVALKQPLKLREDGDALTSEQQSVRNKVFRAALNVVVEGLTHDGAADEEDMGFSMEQLLRAFPDSSKLADGRGWLPMHWAVVVAAAGEGEDKEWEENEDEEQDDAENEDNMTEADVKSVYESDPMALRKHHLVAITDAESNALNLGYTGAHLLCSLEMTDRNMSLVRQLSLSDPRAFTMKAVDVATAAHSLSALHLACCSPRRTEGLLRLLVQLDASQMKSFGISGGPLGLLCLYSTVLDERLFRCLVEADSSVEVVCDGITGCFASPSLDNRVQAVAKLLEVNPAAAQHKAANGRNLAHEACFYSNGQMTTDDCIAALKLVLARHKDALKETGALGMLPAHIAAGSCPVEVLDFVVGEYPEAAAVVDIHSQNLLHFATVHGPEEHRAAKVCLLCARYPHLVLQRNSGGNTPLHDVCLGGHGAMARLLCEVGGQAAASAAFMHATDAEYVLNGWLPLHLLIQCCADTLISTPLSEAADAFRLLLRLYPEAAGTEGGVGASKWNPYQLAVDQGLPTYHRRLLLRAAPHLDPAELRRLNWAERRMAMFVAFVAVSAKPSLLARLRAENRDLVKHVVSYL